jgi:hypothetical protein
MVWNVEIPLPQKSKAFCMVWNVEIPLPQKCLVLIIQLLSKKPG